MASEHGCTVPRLAYKQLYNKALTAAPEYNALEPDRYLVAVLLHTSHSAGELGRDDFLWVKCEEASAPSVSQPKHAVN